MQDMDAISLSSWMVFLFVCVIIVVPDTTTASSFDKSNPIKLVTNNLHAAAPAITFPIKNVFDNHVVAPAAADPIKLVSDKLHSTASTTSVVSKQSNTIRVVSNSLPTTATDPVNFVSNNLKVVAPAASQIVAPATKEPIRHMLNGLSKIAPASKEPIRHMLNGLSKIAPATNEPIKHMSNSQITSTAVDTVSFVSNNLQVVAPAATDSASLTTHNLPAIAPAAANSISLTAHNHRAAAPATKEPTKYTSNRLHNVAPAATEPIIFVSNNQAVAPAVKEHIRHMSNRLPNAPPATSDPIGFVLNNRAVAPASADPISFASNNLQVVAPAASNPSNFMSHNLKAVAPAAIKPTKLVLDGIGAPATTNPIRLFSNDGLHDLEACVIKVLGHTRRALSFARFAYRYGKRFGSEEEMKLRFTIFSENLHLIRSTNKKALSYTLAVNGFADLTWQEFLKRKLRGAQNCLATTKGNHKLTGLVPPETDWRGENALECVKYNRGLGIGKDDDACKFLKENIGNQVFDSIKITQAAEHDLKDAVGLVRPVSVAFKVANDFQFYKCGVYSSGTYGTTPSDVNHAVVVVGYGVEDGVPYWLTKNSWGENWGDNGYFKMEMVKNMCGVATCDPYPDVA